MKTLVFISLVFFGLASLIYSNNDSNNEWNLNELSKADPTAKAWLVQVEGDSLMLRGNEKNYKEALQMPKGKRNINQEFDEPFPIYEGDVIATGVDDRATILLRDGSVVWVNFLTVFKVSELNVPSVVPGQSAESYKVKLKLRVGGLRVRVPKVRTVQKKFSVQTPQGTASVRGTEQIVNYSPDAGLRVQVLSGLVAVQTQSQGTQYATRGEKVAVSKELGTGGSVTVNQQRRTEVNKSVQIASGDAFQVDDRNLSNVVALSNSIPDTNLQNQLTIDQQRLSFLQFILDTPALKNLVSDTSGIEAALTDKTIYNRFVSAGFFNFFSLDDDLPTLMRKIQKFE